MRAFRRWAVLARIAVAALSAATQAAGDPGNGAATPFKATYNFGPATFTCSGAHVVNRNYIKDSQTCFVTGDTTGFVAGTYSGNPSGFIPPCGTCFWQSDFNGVFATSWTETLTDNGDGTFTACVLPFSAGLPIPPSTSFATAAPGPRP